jgi:ribosomal-protein-alanine N-acetyltransferase
LTADTVEGLRDSDIAIVARIHAACFYDAWGPKMLREVLGMPGAFGLAACSGGRGATIGFALARVVADECELLSLGVAPDHRARGVGARLLTASMSRATVAHAAHFFLEVAEDNEPALRLYRSYGLVSVGRRPEYYETESGPRTAALTMRCQLPALLVAP